MELLGYFILPSTIIGVSPVLRNVDANSGSYGFSYINVYTNANTIKVMADTRDPAPLVKARDQVLTLLNNRIENARLSRKRLGTKGASNSSGI
jgi:hypothetical protein